MQIGRVQPPRRLTKSATSALELGCSSMQFCSLSHFLSAGLTKEPLDSSAPQRQAALCFPLHQTSAHLLPAKGAPFGHLNLFGAPRDVESEVYEDAEERVNIFVDMKMHSAFQHGVGEVKRAGGEVGRAAAMVDKALKLVEVS